MADGEVIKDECRICDLVLAGAAVIAAFLAGYMIIDLFTDGRLTAGLSGTLGGKLATVTQLTRDEEPGSDAG